MADRLSSDARSKLMGRIKGKNTRPEIIVRRVAHALGYRFRLHRRDLPGKPDLVFPRLKKVIFVHGCFWHRHDCPRGTMPQTNTEFWEAKFRRNVERDEAALEALIDEGWSPLVVWECETRDRDQLERTLTQFLRNVDRETSASVD